METREISIRVPSEVARFYESASEDKRRKLDALLSIWLGEARQPVRSLEEVMRDATAQARANGLTTERLRELLDE